MEISNATQQTQNNKTKFFFRYQDLLLFDSDNSSSIHLMAEETLALTDGKTAARYERFLANGIDRNHHYELPLINLWNHL
jgi:hypothetical protein